MKITVHVMVKNEYRFIWYALMSVIDYVDKVMLWDTGSTDGTLDIINEVLKTKVGKEKISFKVWKGGLFDEEEVRGEMLNETNTEWFLVVDGDEIWWEDSIKKVIEEIRKNGEDYESLVVPTVNTVGDIFHYSEPQAGHYHLVGRVGHYNLRGVKRTIPGLKSKGRHGVWGWADGFDKQIQERNPKKILYLDAPYLHCTFLERTRNRNFDSSVLKRSLKLKHEIGLSFPKDYYYPEVFFRSRPKNVPSVWGKMTSKFMFRAAFETPLRKVKRRVLIPRIGY